MKPPADLSKLDDPTLLQPIQSRGFPPVGFLKMWDDPYNEGDACGLYWPYGHEDREPLVCYADCGSSYMWPLATRLGPYLDWYRATREIIENNDSDEDDPEYEDPLLPRPRIEAAMERSEAHPEEAMTGIRAAIEDFPEYSEMWLHLATHLAWEGDALGAGRAAIRCVASNWAFDFPAERILRYLIDAAKVPELADDPLVVRARALTLKFGGEHSETDNPNYPILQDCAKAYLESDTPIYGLLLRQNYAFMMSLEDADFQDRHRFNIADWYGEHVELCRRHLGDSRTSIG